MAFPQRLVTLDPFPWDEVLVPITHPGAHALEHLAAMCDPCTRMALDTAAHLAWCA